MRDPARIRDVHIADSLAGLEVPELRGARTICDLGSGAGLPGLVLADALPDARVVCVESARRKADWIAATALRCGLANAEAAWSRAEEWEGSADVVVARAVAELAVLCEYAAPLLTAGGVAVLYKGSVGEAEAADGRAAAALLGLSAPEVIAVTPFARAQRRSLWVFRRVAPLPGGFPRRAGMATKRPLRAGGSSPNPPGAPVPSG